MNRATGQEYKKPLTGILFQENSRFFLILLAGCLHFIFCCIKLVRLFCYKQSEERKFLNKGETYHSAVLTGKFLLQKW
jgi:hypothetical protein